VTCNGGVLMVRSIPVMRNAPSRKTSQRSAEGLPWRIKLAFVPHRWPTPSREDGHRKGGSTRKMTYPKRDVLPRFGTNPPGSKAPDRPDFHRGLGSVRRFAPKRTGNCGSAGTTEVVQPGGYGQSLAAANDVCPFPPWTTKSAWEQRSISLQECHPILVHPSGQTHLLLDNRYNGGNDHLVMVSPCRRE